MQLNIKNNIFTLLPQKAIWWEAEKTLLISDLHIGKIAHFRNAGIALPYQAAEQNFTRLDEIMAAYPIARIIFIGDLFHSDVNQEWDRFCTWRKQYAHVEMLLVLGNHDRFPLQYYQDICIAVHANEFVHAPFTFAHHPQNEIAEGEYIISGHVHPVVKLTGTARQQLRFPCFYFGAQQAILPSFGAFTGGYVIDTKEGEKVVAVVGDKLIMIP